MFAAPLALALASPFFVQQDPAAALRTRLESLARTAIEDALLPGLAAHVAAGERTLLSKGWGYQRASSGTTESPELARDFDAALEPFVAVALLQLVGRDQLDLESPIAKHFPALAANFGAVTVSQVLTHTSGLPDYTEYLRAAGETRDAAAVVVWLAEQSLDSEPGTCFARSESNALLATLLLEKVGGRPLEEALTRAISERAGLERTRFRGVAAAMQASQGGADSRSGTGPAAGPLSSTLLDVSRFFTSLRAGQLLDAEGWRLLSSTAHVRGEELPFAYGLQRSRLGRSDSLAIGSATSAGTTYVSWYPEFGLVIALATVAETDMLPAIERRLARAVLDQPEPEVLDLAMNPEQRAPYLGGYYLGCTRVEIVERGESLHYLSPYGEDFRLRFQGRHRFVAEYDAEVRLEFRMDDGPATEFVITQHGTQSIAKRID